MNNILKQPYTNTIYADFTVYANETQRRVEDFNGDKYALLATEILVDGEVVDISQTPEYIAEQEAKIKAIQNAELQKQIAELDIKRIRAIAEHSQKDENTTWLDFYTKQIQDLRAEISAS